jgi:hypothetical protein
MFAAHESRVTARHRRSAVGRAVRLTAVAGAMITFAGCPYGGPIPLGEPDAAEFLPDLVGEWDAFADDGSRESDCPVSEPTVTIRRSAAAEYEIGYPGDDCRPKLLRGFVIRLDGALFLNLGEPAGSSDDEPGYFILRLYPAGDTIRAKYLNDTLEDVTSVAQLRARVRRQIDDPAIYYDGFMLIRRRQ